MGLACATPRSRSSTTLLKHRLEIGQPRFGQGCSCVGFRQCPGVTRRYGSFLRTSAVHYVFDIPTAHAACPMPLRYVAFGGTGYGCGELLIAGQGEAGKTRADQAGARGAFCYGQSVWVSPGGVFSGCGDLGLAAERPLGWGMGSGRPNDWEPTTRNRRIGGPPQPFQFYLAPTDAPRFCPQAGETATLFLPYRLAPLRRGFLFRYCLTSMARPSDRRSRFSLNGSPRTA